MDTQSINKEITLEYGYDDQDGKNHGLVVMRPIKSKDIIALQKDMRIKSLAADKTISTSSSNPVASMASMGAMLQMFAITFSRVVVSIGTITNPKPEVFEDLFQKDMMTLIDAYNELNGIAIEVKGGGDKEDPLI